MGISSSQISAVTDSLPGTHSTEGGESVSEHLVQPPWFPEASLFGLIVTRSPVGRGELRWSRCPHTELTHLTTFVTMVYEPRIAELSLGADEDVFTGIAVGPSPLSLSRRVPLRN